MTKYSCICCSAREGVFYLENVIVYYEVEDVGATILQFSPQLPSFIILKLVKIEARMEFCARHGDLHVKQSIEIALVQACPYPTG